MTWLLVWATASFVFSVAWATLGLAFRRRSR